jgi:hypothetical protein
MICDQGFDHPEPEPEVTIVEPETTVDNDVRIAEIEASRDVAVAKIAAKVEEVVAETEVEALRREIAGIKEALALVAPAPAVEPEPAPAPEPVTVEAAPEVEGPPPGDHESHEPRKPKSKGLGMWG